MQCDHRMTCFMIGGELLFIIGHHHRATLRAHHHLILGFFKLCHRYSAPPLTRGQQGSFIHQIGEVRPGKTGCAPCDNTWLYIICQRAFAHMYPQDFFAPDHIWIWHNHLTVKTTRTQQGRVKHIRTVRRGYEDNPFIGFEPVHFHQHLVQGLLAFVIAAAKTRPAMATYRINLVNKDDTRSIFLALFEHIAHPACPDTNKHFHKIRTGDGEKRYVGFAGNSPCQQGFTCTRRTNQQHPLWNLAAQTLELARVF